MVDRAGVLYSESTDGVLANTGCLWVHQAGFTINGVDMMHLQKLKKTGDMKMNVSGRQTPKERKKKSDTPTPSSGKISKYLVK